MDSAPVKGAYLVLLTSESYVIGVEVLQWSLLKVKSKYPLVVLHTENTLSQENVRRLEKAGCELKEVERLEVNNNCHMAQSYYADLFTKFHAFNLTQYDQVVMVDADMLVRQNIDDLMTLELPDETWVGASSACLCNPMNVPTYPKHWNPTNCHFTYYTRNSDFGIEPPHKAGSSSKDYFNAGLVVLRPSEKVYHQLISRLRVLKVENYPFGEQDLYNEVFAGKWIRISYAYNALKTLRHVHPQIWNDKDVRIVHYILAKPWNDLNWPGLPEEEKQKMAGQFYEVNTWWFQAYQEMTGSA